MAKKKAAGKKAVAGREDYIFFIGGSGARAYKSFLHACAAGAVRVPQVKCLLLDADATNAACEESIGLYQMYRKNRDLLYSKSAEDQTSENTTQAFRCNVTMFQETAVSPVQSNASNLGLVTGSDNSRDRALSWFYTKEERRQDLSNGFYAHPNIGCIFFQNFGNHRILKDCLRQIRQDLANDREVRVVIVGSVFGGTGAAGIPSILNVIQDNCSDIAGDKLHFCGVLITPYFMVPDKTNDAAKNLPISSKAFYGNTKSALRYYQFTDQFERIYLVGQTDLDSVNPDYADGGERQNNKAHIVELYAAMAVKDFLQSGNPGEEKIFSQILRHTENSRIGWISPSFDPDFQALADMLRAQAILVTEVYPYVEEKSHKKIGGIFQWYKIFRMDDEHNQREMEILRQYSDAFVDWMYHVQYHYKEEKSVELQPDDRIALCGPMIENLMVKVWKHQGKKPADTPDGPDKFDWKAVQQWFNDLIQTGQNLGYVVKKVFLIMSALGFMPGFIAKLGSSDLFTTLFELAGEKS